MTCTTCGRENPPHLTFCQECGQRLGPRIAPPTPPIGLGGDGGSAEPLAARPAVDPYAQPPSRLATSLGAGPSPVAGLVSPPAAPAGASPATQIGGPRRCRVCDTPNGPNLRYCTSCGSTLEAAPPPAAAAPSPAPAPAPVPSPALMAPPAPLQAAPGASPSPAIAPMRVVDLAGARTTLDPPRVCTRCRGVVDPGAQFCKFCGAPLQEAAAAPPPAVAPRTAEPATAHDRLDLPRTNGSPAPPEAAPRALPGTAPMQASAPPVPPAPAPAPARAPAPALSPPTPYAAIIPGPAAHPSSRPPPPLPSQAQAPAPAAPRAVTRGRLVVIAKSGADGPSYPIGDTLDVGRVEGQIIVGEDPYLSPRHVRIAWTGEKLVLRDLASTNGVYIRLVSARDMSSGATGRRSGSVNDAQVAQVAGEVAVPLQDQDLILVGQQVLRFEVLTDAEGGLGPATEHGTLLFGSPAAPRYARLSQRTVEGVTRDVYHVRKVETVLGRESGDVVFTEDPFLSRRHAAVRVLGRDGAPIPAGQKPPLDGVRFALVDLGSSNGSFIRIRGELELVPGDHFRVGQQLFRVDFDAASRAQ